VQKVHRVVTLLRILLVLAFAALVLMQVLSLPGQFAHMAEVSPNLAYLRWPMTAVSVLELMSVQIVIVCTWRLLTMVRDDRIFSERSLVWVDVIIWAIAAAWVLLLGVSSYVVVAIADDPGLPVLLMVILLAGAVLGLLMVVMRALLRQATKLRTDMEAVI
jgi:hypothetical protein